MTVVNYNMFFMNISNVEENKTRTAKKQIFLNEHMTMNTIEKTVETARIAANFAQGLHS